MTSEIDQAVEEIGQVSGRITRALEGRRASIAAAALGQAVAQVLAGVPAGERSRLFASHVKTVVLMVDEAEGDEPRPGA